MQFIASTPLFFRYVGVPACSSEDTSFEDLTEESRKLAWGNMEQLEVLSTHKIHKEWVHTPGCCALEEHHLDIWPLFYFFFGIV